jgi:hypothetical protein
LFWFWWSQKRSVFVDDDPDEEIMMLMPRLALAAAAIWGVSAVPFVNSIKVGDKVSTGSIWQVSASSLAGLQLLALSDGLDI